MRPGSRQELRQEARLGRGWEQEDVEGAAEPGLRGTEGSAGQEPVQEPGQVQVGRHHRARGPRGTSRFEPLDSMGPVGQEQRWGRNWDKRVLGNWETETQPTLLQNSIRPVFLVVLWSKKWLKYLDFYILFLLIVANSVAIYCKKEHSFFTQFFIVQKKHVSVVLQINCDIVG